MTEWHDFKLAIKMTEVLGLQKAHNSKIISEWTLALLESLSDPEEAEDAIRLVYGHPKVKHYLTDINFCELANKME